MTSKTPFFMVLLSASLWGTTGTAQTFLQNSHPISVGAMRLAVGGVFLFAVAVSLRKFSFKGLPKKYVACAAVCMACYQPFFFSAVSMTGVAVGTVVGIGSAPIMAGAIDWLIMKRNKSWKWWSATSLSILGCLLLFVNSEDVVIHPLGILFALGAGLSFAGYTLLSEKLVKNESPVSVSAVVFLISAVLLAPFLFLFDSSWLLNLNGVLVSLHLGVLATGAAYLLFSKGLVQLQGSTAVSLSLAEPLTAAILGVFVVGEMFSLLSWAGIALIFSGLTILSVPHKKTYPKAA
ncbi:EamA family transporter [Halobacillus sp. A5]|uniref:EamA family transporter n=1 Tax=Halobacillus sp. A5 TaxID=2880263 RepID=UPI0020A6C05B|nr:EamA family transporter [Halobacillus sp. A5]MCP3027275.1 DMT family transporter [Halobacillus sp. A5]